MEYREFIDTDEFKEFYRLINILPIKIENDSLYLKKLKETFKMFIDATGKIVTIKEDIKIDITKLKKICRVIEQAVEEYLNGNNINAIKQIEKLFDKKQYGDELFTVELKKGDKSQFSKLLYRARIGTDIVDREEMLHIPFNMRKVVATQRYSIPGYPCLYLSGSIYGCWLELNKPNINELYVSRYEVNRDIKVLDLSLLPQDVFCGKLSNDSDIYIKAVNGSEIYIEDIISKYLYTWPIICASSFIVKEEGRVFKSEYIIPQLLVQVIRNRTIGSDQIEVEGIRYFSTKCNYDSSLRPNPLYYNYVFITDNKSCITKNSKIYSKNIIENFSLTYPVNMQIAFLINEAGIVGTYCTQKNAGKQLLDIYKDSMRAKSFIEVTPDCRIQYGDFYFFQIERFLCNIGAGKIDY